ncbi:MAG: flagellar basal body P-ring formation protein FlgA [Flavobacteriales bacterium]|nr:flagellar basal body P-ring formation protein FlgA [Flavobacteriales bacterium]
MNRFCVNLIQGKTVLFIAYSIPIICGMLTMPLSAHSEESITAKTQILSAVASFSKKLTENQRYSRIDTTLPHLDPRLRLATCNTPLDVKSTSTRKKLGRLTLKISCFDQKNWSLHVPLELKAYESVVVAVQPIFRGQIISAGNVAKEEREVTRLNQGYFSKPDRVVGSIAKRSINTHQVILPRSLSKPKLVNKGESISIQAIGAGLSIKAMGVALADGSLGDLIQVKNSKTQRIIEGRISAPGQIVIHL